MTKVLDCSLKVSVFELQSHYYFHFWTNTIWNGMNTFITHTCYELSSINAILLQR